MLQRENEGAEGKIMGGNPKMKNDPWGPLREDVRWIGAILGETFSSRREVPFSSAWSGSGVFRKKPAGATTQHIHPFLRVYRHCLHEMHCPLHAPSHNFFPWPISRSSTIGFDVVKRIFGERWGGPRGTPLKRFSVKSWIRVSPEVRFIKPFALFISIWF